MHLLQGYKLVDSEYWTTNEYVYPVDLLSVKLYTYTPELTKQYKCVDLWLIVEGCGSLPNNRRKNNIVMIFNTKNEFLLFIQQIVEYILPFYCSIKFRLTVVESQLESSVLVIVSNDVMSATFSLSHSISDIEHFPIDVYSIELCDSAYHSPRNVIIIDNIELLNKCLGSSSLGALRILNSLK